MKSDEKDFIELQAEIFGSVQAVGFRFFAVREAKKLGLTGWIRNTERDTVEVLVQGKEKTVQEFLKKIERGPAFASVQKVEIIFRKPQELFTDFSIKH